MKILKSYRLEENTIKKLEELTKMYEESINKMSPVKAKITMTDVVEMLINNEYMKLKENKNESN